MCPHRFSQEQFMLEAHRCILLLLFISILFSYSYFYLINFIISFLLGFCKYRDLVWTFCNTFLFFVLFWIKVKKKFKVCVIQIFTAMYICVYQIFFIFDLLNSDGNVQGQSVCLFSDYLVIKMLLQRILPKSPRTQKKKFSKFGWRPRFNLVLKGRTYNFLKWCQELSLKVLTTQLYPQIF